MGKRWLYIIGVIEERLQLRKMFSIGCAYQGVKTANMEHFE